MIHVKQSGSFKKTEDFLEKARSKSWESIVRTYADKALRRLSDNTPEDTGRTADKWRYEISSGGNSIKVEYYNDNVNEGYCVALLIQYGHATRGKGYVAGVDYINPAFQPVADDLANTVWKELIS